MLARAELQRGLPSGNGKLLSMTGEKKPGVVPTPTCGFNGLNVRSGHSGRPHRHADEQFYDD